ncbi:hypothetical protein DWY27_09330, partial [Clostridium sp. AF24-2LB]
KKQGIPGYMQTLSCQSGRSEFIRRNVPWHIERGFLWQNSRSAILLIAKRLSTLMYKLFILLLHILT